jgi:hypothetical protein
VLHTVGGVSEDLCVLRLPVMTIVGDSDEGMLLRGTDDKAVDVLVVTDRFIHE